MLAIARWYSLHLADQRSGGRILMQAKFSQTIKTLFIVQHLLLSVLQILELGFWNTYLYHVVCAAENFTACLCRLYLYLNFRSANVGIVSLSGERIRRELLYEIDLKTLRYFNDFPEILHRGAENLPSLANFAMNFFFGRSKF